jgi:hypothetical protein
LTADFDFQLTAKRAKLHDSAGFVELHFGNSNALAVLAEIALANRNSGRLLKLNTGYAILELQLLIRVWPTEALQPL